MRRKAMILTASGILALAAANAVAADLTLSLYDLTGTTGSWTGTTSQYSATTGGWDVVPAQGPDADIMTLGDFHVDYTTAGSLMGGNWYVVTQLSVTNIGAGPQQFRVLLSATNLGAGGYNGVRTGFGGNDSDGTTAMYSFTESVGGSSHTFPTQTGPTYDSGNITRYTGSVDNLSLTHDILISNIAAGQTVSFAAYSEVVALATGNATDVNLGAIHINGDFASKTTTITNASSGTGQSVTAVIAPGANVTLGGVAGPASITNPMAETTSGRTLAVGYTATTVAGAVSQSANAQFTSTGTNGTVQTNSDTIAIAGMIYSGQSEWMNRGGGTWGGDPQNRILTHDGTMANPLWSADAGAPGVWSGFDAADTATFANSIGSSDATIDVIANGSTGSSVTSVKSITFNNDQGGSYTIADGGGSLQLKSDSGPAHLDDLAGNHRITVPITMQSNVTSNVARGADKLTVSQLIQGGTGEQTLTKTGSGTLLLTGTSTYTGRTTIQAGTVEVDGAIASAVDVKSGGTLAGTNGHLSGVATVYSGGTISPGTGNSASTLTTGGQIWNAGGKYEVDITAVTGTGLQLGAGAGYDTLAGTTLDLTDLDSGNKFTLLVDGRSLADGTFVYGNTYKWDIASFANGITVKYGYGLSDINSFFAISLSYVPTFRNGQWSISADGGPTSSSHLYLNYNAVPEASTALLGTLAVMPLLSHRRRRHIDAATDGVAGSASALLGNL